MGRRTEGALLFPPPATHGATRAIEEEADAEPGHGAERDEEDSADEEAFDFNVRGCGCAGGDVCGWFWEEGFWDEHAGGADFEIGGEHDEAHVNQREKGAEDGA